MIVRQLGDYRRKLMLEDTANAIVATINSLAYAVEVASAVPIASPAGVTMKTTPRAHQFLYSLNHKHESHAHHGCGKDL